MSKIYIGKIVNTHGIKGEVKILSNVSNKDKIFVPGNKIYIGNDMEIIDRYRHHKIFDMIKIKGIDNINDVLKYKGCKVYIDIEEIGIKDNEYILEELVGYNINNEGKILGKVREIVYNNGNTLLGIDYDRNYYIPYSYIVDVNKKERVVNTKDVEGLIL